MITRKIISIILMVFALSGIPGVMADISYAVIGDSIIRGSAAYGSRMDTAPNGWNPGFVSHSGTFAGEIQSITGNTAYNNAVGGEVSGVPGPNGALSNTPEGLRNRWYRDAVGGTDTTLTDSPRPTKTLNSKPNVIIAMIGTNDCGYNKTSYGGYSWTVDTTRENIEWMNQNATDNDIYTIWLVPSPVNDYCDHSYINSLREWELTNLSKRAGVYDTYSFFNDPGHDGYVKAEYAADAIHLNDAAWVAVTPYIYSDFQDIFRNIPPAIQSGFSINGSGYAIANFSYPIRMATSAINPDTGYIYSSSMDPYGQTMQVYKPGGLAVHDPIGVQYDNIMYIWRVG